MKKLLVLTLVLGIASLATAGFDLSQTGPTTADIVGAGNVAGGGVFLGIVGGAVNITDVSGLDTVFIADITSDAGTKAFVDSLIGTTSDQLWQTNFADTAGGLPNGILANIEGVGTLYAFDGATGAPLAANGLTLVPEPATMALLGLGALVLRRKK